MSGLKTGLTERTTKSLQLNAGVLLSNYVKGNSVSEDDIIGATRGGGTISITPTIRQVAVDGAPTYTKGLERIDDVVAQLSFTMIEFTPVTLKKAIVGSTATSGATDVTITSVSKVLATDYSDVWWVGDTSDGKNVVIHLKNAMNTAGLSITASDKGEGTFGLTLTAHYDVSNLENAPYEIILEGAVG